MAITAAAVFMVAALVASGSALDDAFIFSRYARNLIDYKDLIWNVGEPRIEGFTSWAWLGVQALGLKLGWHPVGFSRLVGIFLGSVFAGIFVAALHGRVGVWPTLAFLLVGVLSPDMWFYAASGMDTILWTLSAWLWLVWFARQDVLTVGHVASAGALLFVRPEALLLLALCAIRAALQAWTRRTSWREATWPLMIGSLVPAAVILGRYLLFGQLVANSVAAKHLGGNPGLRAVDGLNYLAQNGQLYLVPAAVVLALTLAVGKGPTSVAQVLASAPSRLVAALGSFAVLTLAMVAAAGGDDTAAFPFARLLVPILCPAAYCLAVAFDSIAVDRRRRRAASLILLALFSMASLPRAREAVKLSSAATNMTSIGGLFAAIRERAAPGNSRASNFLAQATPPGEMIAVPWAGRIPYETGLRTLDLLGLNDRHIAAMPPPQRGIDVKYDADYVFRRRPYFICESVMLRVPTPEIVQMSSDALYAAGAWKLGQRTILRDPRLASEYTLDTGASEATGGTCFRRTS